MYANPYLYDVIMFFYSFSGFEKMSQDSPSTARKTGQPSKLVDLGAAAAFAQQSASTQQQAPSSTQQGLLFGDSQQPKTTATSSTGGAGGFADFEAAFQGPSEETQSAGTRLWFDVVVL